MRTKKRHYPARSDALKIIGYIDPSDLDWNPRPSGPGDTRTINVRSTPAVKCISPIVLEVCARAKTSKRDADIARLQAALAEIELGIDALSDEDDDGRRIPAREMKRQALEVIRSEIKALKGDAP